MTVGVDIEPKQLEFARGHLERSGVEATLQEGDALALPFADESFDHVWMMWLLEHIADPTAALREARRVLVPGGAITAIEVDYSTCRAEPSTPALEALFRAIVQGMAAAGWSDAGARLPGWLREAGFQEIDEGEGSFWWQGDDLVSQAGYAADVIESALDALAQQPGATEVELRAGLEDLPASDPARRRSRLGLAQVNSGKVAKAMRFGLKVNPGTWDEATLWAGIAEDAGFDGLWTGDNMRNPRDPAIPVHDGPTLISAWAVTTDRIRVGLLIANVVFRRPTVLAKQAVTLDHLSAGRFDLGIGSGLWPTDHDMSGVPMWTPRERADRLAEFVAVVDRLLSGDVGDSDGAYYPYQHAAMTPGPVQTPIPLIVAANAPRALAVAARHAQGWVTFPGTATEEEFHQASIERISMLEQLSGDRAPLRKILLAYGSITPWSSRDAFAELVERYRRIGFDEIVCYAPKPHERAVFDELVADLDAWR
ncbi:MAG: LLM class flavin-dependent oxidoreductase [Gaiellaceae bacterium]